MPATILKQAPIAGVAVPIAILAVVGVAIAARDRSQPGVAMLTMDLHLSRLWASG